MDANKNKDNYIDLKINGRLFPSWLLANYKQYKLDNIVDDGTDKCNTKREEKELTKYQAFLGKYLNFNSRYKNILICYGTGSGKTRSAINIYNILYNYTPGWNVFVLLPAALKPNFEAELNQYLESEDKDARKGNINFISFNASNADKIFIEKMQKSDSSKKNIFIFDEVQKFISNVYSNISSKKGKRAQFIYDYIIQDQQENHDTRVILLSATPVQNNVFEFALLFNLLRPNSFPKKETVFNQEFISGVGFKILSPLKKNIFQRRILGLVSYYAGATKDVFATKKTEYVNVKIDSYQEDILRYFESVEEKIAKKKKSSSGIDVQKLKTYTRQACNFVFPYLEQSVNGEMRPRPKNFKISEKLADDLMKGKLDENTNKEVYNATKEYFNAMKKYTTLFENYIDEANNYDNMQNYTLKNDIDKYIDKYDYNFDEFNNNETKKSTVYSKLYACSAKMICILFKMLQAKGPVLFYSNFVLMEGIEVFKIYMKYFDYYPYEEYKNDKSKNGKRFVEYHGMVDMTKRKKIIEIHQMQENKYGEINKVILMSPAGAEGLNIYSMRQVHILEPYWQETRIEQTIGRAVRLCGHKFLPLNERHVDVFRYKSVRQNYPNAKITTDQYIEDASRSKQGLIDSFLDAIKEAAVDCELFKPHNKLNRDHKCFQFNEPSLFDKQIGPAFKEDFADDKKIDNGSNSVNSKTLKIKVFKIQAVKQLDSEAQYFSKPEFYYYYPDTGVVYDFDLHFAIGKVKVDDSNIPIKMDTGIYIIDKLIPIPILN